MRGNGKNRMNGEKKMAKKIRKICVRIIKDFEKIYEYNIDYKKWVDWCDENNLEQGFDSFHKYFLSKLDENLYEDIVQIEYLY